MPLAYMGLGANLGEPYQQLAQAMRAMDAMPEIRVVSASSLYWTRPEGGAAQPEYLNAVAAVETSFSARALWEAGQRLEAQAGRTRGERNAPRVLDLDLLLYEACICGEPDLIVPHPRLAQRPFVVIPLAEIAPNLRHPVLGVTMAELAQGLPRDGIRVFRAGGSWAGL